MTGLRLVCALKALDPYAKPLTRLFTAEGFIASIATGKVGLEELTDPNRDREQLIVIWSEDSAYSPYVRPWLEGVDASGLIEIETAKGAAPPLQGRTHAPIDFTNWRGDRGSPEWIELQKRARIAVYGPPPAPGWRAQAAMLFGALALAALGAAGVMRMFDDGTQTAEAGAPAPAPLITEDRTAMGGPIAIMAELDDPPFRPAYSATLQPLPVMNEPPVLLELATEEREEVRDPSFLGRISETFR